MLDENIKIDWLIVSFQHLHTPFHLAVKNCHIPVIHTLLEAGCDPDVKDHVRYLFSYTICEIILSLHAHVSVIYY